MKQYYAVIDTNVIVSSFLHHDSVPGQVVDHVVSGRIIPLINQDILEEYSEVLRRNKFGIPEEVVSKFLALWSETGIFLDREKTLEDFIDQDDVVFFEVALSGRSTMDAYLVTGNLKHYPIRNYVVTPRQMLEIIEREG